MRDWDVYAWSTLYWNLPPDVQASLTLDKHAIYLKLVGRLTFDPLADNAGMVLADRMEWTTVPHIEPFRGDSYIAATGRRPTHLIVPSGTKFYGVLV